MQALTQTQFDALAEGQTNEFVRRCAAALRAAFPAETKSLSEQQLADFARASAAQARSSRIVRERDACRLAEMHVIFGRKWIDNDQAPWGLPILNETGVGGGARMDLLFAAAVWSMEKKGRVIPPADLRASAARSAFEDLWRARGHLKRRSLSLAAFDRDERTAWLQAYETALVDVAPYVQTREPPADAAGIELLSSDQSIGSPIVLQAGTVESPNVGWCRDAVGQIVDASVACIRTMDDWLVDSFSDPRSAQRAEAGAWHQIAAAQRRGPPLQALSSSARIAGAAVDAIRKAGPNWLKGAQTISREKPARRTAVDLMLKIGDRLVFDWTETLNPYGPRITPYDAWVEGAG